MVFRAVRVALLLSALPAAGCGTAANLIRPGPEAGGKVPFGGVKNDLRCIEPAAGGAAADPARPAADADHYPRFVLGLVCAADLPLSLVGDLVTWPYTVAYTCINEPVPVPPIPVVSVFPRPAARPMPAPPNATDKPAGPPVPIPVPPLPPPKGGDSAPPPKTSAAPAVLPRIPVPGPAPRAGEPSLPAS